MKPNNHFYCTCIGIHDDASWFDFKVKSHLNCYIKNMWFNLILLGFKTKIKLIWFELIQAV